VLKPGETAGGRGGARVLPREIAHYKIPRYIKFVDGFPRPSPERCRKFAMREAMIAELDLVLEKTA
jgi:fatty-acyl-CoA synthase